MDNLKRYLMAADGSGPVDLTNDPADEQMPFGNLREKHGIRSKDHER